MQADFVDHLVQQWRAARPDLDPGSMGVAARLMRVGALLERRLAALLEPHDLSIGAFDVLATLRRSRPAGVTPTELLEQTLLSSGAMTNRIDRLEASGLVERAPNPADRRGVIVRLTRKGRQVVDRAVEDRFDDARAVAAVLGPARRASLEGALRCLAVALDRGS